MGIERYEGNSANSVATLEGEIVAIKKRHFAICVTSCKSRNLTNTNGYTSKCEGIQNAM